MRHLLMGVAAIAMAASVSQANPGNGNGKGNGNAKAKNSVSAPAKAPGNRNEARGPSQKSQGFDRPAKQASQGNGNGNAKANGNADANAGNRNGPSQKTARPAQANRVTNVAPGNGNAARGNAAAGPRNGAIGGPVLDNRNARGSGAAVALGGPLGLVQGCPPGLAKKQNGCQPPGQAKKNTYGYLPSLFGLGDRRSGNYFYNDGYLLQSGGTGISAWLPLLGGALSIGSQWPGGYESRRLPDYYENYYSLGGRNSYRYADNVVYRVDPETEAIRSIAALLTGDDFAVGQPVPVGYDVYNVPRAYQDRYYDQPGRQYRYSDGYIYQVDPETRLVAAAIELIV